MKTTFKNSIKLIFIFALFLFNFAFFMTPAHAATASFSTSGGGTVATSQTVSVTVTAKASSAFNAVTLNVNFANLTYVSASVAGGWTTVSGPTRSGNTVSYSGALLGSSSTSKAVLTLVFRAPASAGSGTVSGSGWVALADGSGTPVGAVGNTVTYTAVAPTATAAPTPTPLAVPNAVTVTSSTHPDQNTAYKGTTAVLNWNKQESVTDFSYIVDQSPSTTPDDTTEGADVSKTVNNLSEGTIYFHIKAKNSSGWGAVTHFAIKVDLSNPNPFTPTAVKDSTQYFIYFATDDLGSGIKQYSVTADGRDLGTKSTGVSLPLTTKEVFVTAEDNAGNTVQSVKLALDESAVPTVSATTTPASTTSSNQNVLLITLLVLLGLYALVMTILSFRSSGQKKLFNSHSSNKVVTATPTVVDTDFGKSPIK